MGLRLVEFARDLVTGALMVLVIPVAVLVVGTPIAVVVRVVLSSVGLL